MNQLFFNIRQGGVLEVDGYVAGYSLSIMLDP